MTNINIIHDLRVFLTQHYYENKIMDGELYALSVWTRKNKDGTMSSGETWERIDPTWKAVKEWAGY